MPSILVVEQEQRSAERIYAALSAEGWQVRVLPGIDQALRSAASEAPDLVLASAEVPGAEILAGSFSRRAGGPGLIGLVAGTGGASLGADDVLAKPFSDQDLVMAARRALLRRQSATASPAAAVEHKLTSHDIFGDVLAEVEGDPSSPAAAPAPRPAAPPPVAPSPAAAPQPAPPPSPRPQDEDVNRRLEKTLSGVLGAEPRPRPAAPAAPAPPARRPEGFSDEDVDALISKTLSTLDLGRTKPGVPRPAPAAPPAPQPVAAPPPRPAAPAPAPAPPPAPRPPAAARMVGDFDFAELEELARTGTRKPEPAPPPRPAAPPTPQPAQWEAPELPAVAPPAPAPAPPPTLRSVLANAAATQRIPVMPALDETADHGVRFGQYTLLERIAAGGMAEVWKARMRGVEGFQKTVAIKKILPHMTDNLEFISMFVDEAKLAAQLNHPNIVHIYDLGKISREYYIAMEYVEGKDLRSLLNTGRRKGQPLPVGLALLIAARLASALEYAHRKRDFEDRELNLVHRDVSPQNVLLTSEGDVKLCDFGIAKAVSKAGHTQMGALKGKLQYMSPEQAWGRPVDSRSDIFSLGVVLFEMATGEKLFPGDTEISVLEAVRQGRVRPPSQLNPAVNPEMEEIILRAVAADPRDRFQTAGEMKQRIEAVLATLTPAPSPTDLAAYLRRVGGEPETGELELPVPAFPAAEPPAPMVQAPSLATGEPPEPEPVIPSDPAVVPAVAPVGDVLVEVEGGGKGRILLYAAIVALLVLAVVAFFYFNRGKAASPPAAAPPPAAAVPESSPAPGALAQPESSVPPASPSAAAPVDVAGLVEEQMAKSEEELRRKKEEEIKRLERQVAALKAAGQKAPAPATAPATPPPPAPEPAATPATAPPPGPEPEPEPPPKIPERAPAPAPEPVRLREPDPEPAQQTPRTNVGDLVAAGSGVAAPKLVSSPKPEYPPMARNLRVEGIVVVSVLVDENGRVQDVRMAEPIKQKVGINEAALDAARGARYQPATKDGVRVKMWTRLRIPFKL